MEIFKFTIALSGDPESMRLLRELSRQVARAAAGLDESGARQAGDELVDAIERRPSGTDPSALNVSFEWIEVPGPVDVKVTGDPDGAEGSRAGQTDVQRSWGSSS